MQRTSNTDRSYNFSTLDSDDAFLCFGDVAVYFYDADVKTNNQW